MWPMPSLRFRAQEALAERFRWVQFPRIEKNRPRFWGVEQTAIYVFLFGRVDPSEPSVRLQWKNKMSLWRRILIFCLSLVLLYLAVLVVIFVLIPLYLFVRALVSS